MVGLFRSLIPLQEFDLSFLQDSIIENKEIFNYSNFFPIDYLRQSFLILYRSFLIFIEYPAYSYSFELYHQNF